jgi:hypothetical protein
MVLGNPNVEKICLNAVMMDAESGRGKMTASTHFDVWSTTTISIFPATGPARSTLSCVHGSFGQFVGVTSVSGVALAHCWH